MTTHIEHHQQADERDPLDVLRTRLARDLREVGQLADDLRVEAWHRHSDRDLPGGDALAMIGPYATVTAFAREVDRVEEIYYRGRAAGHKVRWPEIYDLDTDPQPPLAVLVEWVDIVRRDQGRPASTLEPTIDRELAYLRGSLDWMTSRRADDSWTWLPIDALARDIARLRRRLEAVLHDGPDDRTVPCIRCTGDERGRLEPQWGADIEGDDDTWRCTRCTAVLNRVDFRRALEAARRITATALTASDILLEYRVKPSTLRKWAERGVVHRRGRDSSGRQTYDVDDVLAARERAAKGDNGRMRPDEQHETAPQDASSDLTAPNANDDEIGPQT